jgi:hypothetical protein
MRRSNLSGLKRVKRRAGVAVLAVGLPLVVFAPSAPAESSAAFSAVASADGIRISAFAPGFLVAEEVMDGGGPTAQASISDLEGSQGFASVPYPGSNALAFPGIFAIVTGQQFPASYPFFVASSHPTTPEGKVDQPGLYMESKSDAGSSAASARFGPSDKGGNASSSAKVARQADGGVTAEALGVADFFEAGPVKVKGFVSKAQVTRSPGGEPQRSSSMEFASMTIGDTPITMRGSGLVVGGTTVPFEGFAPVREALKQAGVTVEVLQATDTEDGVLSPGLQITRQQEFPGGTLNVTYTLGRTLAAARAAAVAPSVDLGLGSAPELGDSGASADPGTPSLAQESATEPASLSEAASPFAGDAGLGFSGSGSATDVAASPADSSAAVAAPSPGTATEGAELVASQPAPGPKSPVSGWGLFPMLLLAGGLLAAAPLSRRLTF